MKTALVLGAAGFIGRHAARALAEAGYDVAGIGHGSWSPEEQRRWGVGRWHVADVTLDALLTHGGQPDVMIQAAGSGSVPFSVSHPVQDYTRSVDTTLAALEFMRLHAPGCRLVLPSSAAVYGNARELPIRVDAPLRPVSPYGTHKMIAEELCRSFARQFHLSVAVVRLFSIYGVGLRKQLIWDAFHKLRAGEGVFFGSGDEGRDMLHVIDAAALLLAAAGHASAECPTVNGGSGTVTSVRALVGLVAEASGTVEAVRFSGAARSGDPQSFQAEIAEALRWGWQPRRVLATEIAAIAEWIDQGAP